ncbi:type IV pilus assembly protein PilB [Candidatus Moduliflexus flocculans]|uniref:Type IV pilus assembly protein PilB n=1 Tax=Candidatus Moduliflexus flocculans TaxID=1499966 RepID=A0A0S6VUN1_9BACT|nr:type IV pilus assembly protein PilB [Candidatus Moduliflexus flocculans]
MKQNRTIGSILLDVELVSQKDIEQALELQKQSGKRLGEVLVQLGVVSDDDIRWALAEQLNLPYVNIRKDQVDTDVAKLLPENLARRYHVIPILKIEHELTVVVDDPLNTTIIKDIEQITKCSVKISLGRTSDILLAIDEIYGSSEERQDRAQELPPQFTSQWFQEDDIQKILNDPSGQVLMELIFLNAFQHNVSRIHFQPGEETCHVSYRVNGNLREIMRLSKEWFSILLFRLKISAGLEVSHVQHTQYREFLYQDGNEAQEGEMAASVPLAISILPTEAGETVLVNVMNRPVNNLWDQVRSETISSIQEQELAEVFALQEDFPHWKTGAILIGGASPSEALRTGFALLNAYPREQKKTVVLEATSEYRVDNCSHIRYIGGKYSQLSPDIVAEKSSSFPLSSLTSAMTGSAIADIASPSQRQFAIWLNLLRPQDVDVLLADHIEHYVAVAQCMEIAGHAFVFGLFELPTTFDMLAYLLDCNVKPSILATRLRGLVAQLSVRILCEACKCPDESEQAQRIAAQWQQTDAPPTIYKPSGCLECQMTGYASQALLFEILRIDAYLQDALRAGTLLKDMRQIAETHGFQSLRTKALNLLYSGQTGIREVFSLLA